MFGHSDQQQHNQPAADGALSNDDQALSLPTTDDGVNSTDTAGEFIDDAPTGASDVMQPSDSVVTPSTPAATVSAPAMATNTDKLLELKQQALQQLSPLVDHLEQTPEEEFRTTMMMIQAADNHELIERAYQAALKITDEKARAQALLDIVNEINYFTHNNAGAA